MLLVMPFSRHGPAATPGCSWPERLSEYRTGHLWLAFGATGNSEVSRIPFPSALAQVSAQSPVPSLCSHASLETSSVLHSATLGDTRVQAQLLMNLRIDPVDGRSLSLCPSSKIIFKRKVEGIKEYSFTKILLRVLKVMLINFQTICLEFTV